MPEFLDKPIKGNNGLKASGGNILTFSRIIKNLRVHAQSKPQDVAGGPHHYA